MPSRPVLRQLDAADLLQAAGVVRRYLDGLGVDEDNADDVVQETVTRIWENRWRVDRRTTPGYAIATSRSLLAEQSRRRGLDARNLPRLHEPVTVPDASVELEQADEYATLAAALVVLPPRDRALLVAHHVDEVSVDRLAHDAGTSPGALAAALKRARGRLRLEYCLQAYGRSLPDRCRQVLTSLALGEVARQRALGAGRHLAACEHCGPLAEVVTAKDRHRAGLGPLVVLVALLGWLRRSAVSHPVTAGATAATAAAGATVAVVLVAHHTPVHPPQAAPPPVRTTAAPTSPRPSPSRRPRPSPRPSPSPAASRGLLLGGRNLLPTVGAQSLLGDAGRSVRGVDVPVLAVDADEGFWVGSSSHRIWVQLLTQGESRQTIKAGDVLSFTGRIAANRPDFAASVGLVAREDAALVRAQQVHVDVAPDALKIVTAAAQKH